MNGFRSKLRDTIYQESVELIEEYKEKIKADLDNPEDCEFAYKELQKILDKNFLILDLSLSGAR